MLILCITIFFARLLDVSLGTIRTVYTVKGKNLKASMVGFIEITIWFLIVKEALNTENNSAFIVLSYALGFSLGTYIGGFLSTKLIRSKLTVQIITGKEYSNIAKRLREEKFAVTIINSSGFTKNHMLFVQIPAEKLRLVKRIIYQYDKKAFIVVNEAKQVLNGYFGI